jgi:putative ABC transport system permease protein
MVIYTTKNRLKEVSIRKIMGASAGQIIFKISKEFLGLLGVAIGVGLPAGLFVSVQLLQQYAYRIPVGAEILGVVLRLYWP